MSLKPDIIEVTGLNVESQIRQLMGLESVLEDAISALQGHSKVWFAQVLASPGCFPDVMLSPELATRDTAECAFGSKDEELKGKPEVRQFCTQQVALVVEQLLPRLRTVWLELSEEERNALCFHAVVTIQRSEGTRIVGPIHSDSFDGTLCAFGLMSSKIGTPIYPQGQVAWVQHKERPPMRTTALSQFLEESDGTPGVCRPGKLRYDEHQIGPCRVWRSGSLVIMPSCVCHAIASHKACDARVDDHTVAQDGTELASSSAPRWFCRITLQIIPAGPTVRVARDPWRQFSRHAWPSIALRRRVAYLNCKHVWRSKELAEEAKTHWEANKE
eukprot:m.364318 g.364318  ORF g.364318 m.364318 type:complete len:330 (-) comp26567_c0_seq1:36-1025(-)